MSRALVHTDVNRDALVTQQHQARALGKRGLGLLALAPANALCFFVVASLVGGTTAYQIAFALTTLVGLVSTGAGATMIVAGSMRHHRLTERIAELDAVRALPEARVVRDGDRR